MQRLISVLSLALFVGLLALPADLSAELNQSICAYTNADSLAKCNLCPQYSDPARAKPYFEKGNANFKAGNYSWASYNYKIASMLNPDDLEALKWMGRSLNYMGKYDEAIKCYDAFLEIQSCNAEVWNLKGMAFYNLSRFNESKDCFENAVLLRPKEVQAWLNKGKALYSMGNYDESIDAYDRCLSINDSLAECWFNKARALYKKGDVRGAIGANNRAIDLNPNYYQAWFNKGCYLLYYHKNSKNSEDGFRESREAFSKVISLINNSITNNLTPKSNRENIYALRNNSKTCICYSYVNDNLNEYRKCYENESLYFDSYGRKDLAAEANNYIGKLYCDLDDYEYYVYSLKYFDNAIDRKENFSQAWYNKGIAQVRLGRLQDSLLSFNKASEIDPDFAQAYCSIGLVLLELRKYDLSMQYFNESINKSAKADTSGEDWLWKAWYGKGNALAGKGSFKEAIKAYDESLTLNGGATEALMGEGIALCRSGEYIKALSSFDKALKALGSDRSNPLYAEALFRKGDVLYNLGLYVDAIDNYEAARNQNIGNPLSSFALIVLCYLALISGYLYMKRGNPLSSVCLDMALIILSGLLAFCAVLAGFLDMRQISYFLLEVFIVFILALVLWVLFSPKGHNLKQKLDLSLFEFELNHYFISKYFSALSCSFVFLCSVVSILSYFHDTFLSNYPELSIIRGALAILLTSSLIISMPIFVGMISCKNIDDDIRSTVMICQFFYLSLIGLFMYWLLWSFGIQGFDHTTFYFFDLSFDINPLMLIMAVLFLFSFLFPYLYGWRRTKSARGSILARQNKWLDELADILKKPLTDQLVAASEGFADQLDAEKSDLIRVRANRAVLFMLIWKVDHDLDYRMKYLDFLSRLHDQLLYCIPQLEPVIIKQDVKAAKDIQGYLDVVLGLKNKTDERMALEGKSRPQLWIGLVSVASPILSPIITGLIVKLGVPMQSAGVTELIKGALTNLPSIS